MASQAICSSSFGNLGSLCESGNTLAPTVGIILTTDSFEFSSASDFADLSKYEEAIKAKQMFPLMNIIETTDNTDETAYQETSLGRRIKLRAGFYKYTFDFLLPLSVTKELNKFSGAKLRYFRVDDNGQIQGYSPDGITYKGFSISNFDVEKMKSATADSVALTPVSIVEQNAQQLNSFGAVIQPTWEAQSLNALTNVEVKVIGQPTSSEIHVSLNYVSGLNPDGSPALVPINGMTNVGDWIFTNTQIVPPTNPAIETVTAEGDGLYLLGGTQIFDNGTIDLQTPLNQVTTGVLIESIAPAAVTGIS